MEEKEKVIEIEIERLRDFKEHPFHVKDDKRIRTTDQDNPYGEKKIKQESDDRRDSSDNGGFQNKLCKRYCLKATGNLWNKDKDF